MFGQQREKNQKPLSQEGMVELSDEQLEAVAGGNMGSPAAATYRYDQGYLSVLQFAYKEEQTLRPITIVNQTVTTNNISAQAGNQTGVEVTQNNRKK